MYEEIPLTFGILNSGCVCELLMLSKATQLITMHILPVVPKTLSATFAITGVGCRLSSSESFFIAATVFDTASVLLSALLCASVGLPGGWFCSTSRSRVAGEISGASKTFGIVVVAFLGLIGIFLKLKTLSPFKTFSMVLDLLSVIGGMIIAILQRDSSAAVIGRVQATLELAIRLMGHLQFPANRFLMELKCPEGLFVRTMVCGMLDIIDIVFGHWESSVCRSCSTICTILSCVYDLYKHMPASFFTSFHQQKA
ncbi:hypothetical protein K439DRAFT_1619368 [Ramaria rubella]|nr:hypothetical protein K439DRAFT_1619368 [Ramaria rubella]